MTRWAAIMSASAVSAALFVATAFIGLAQAAETAANTGAGEPTETVAVADAAAPAAESAWLASYDKATERAKAQGRYIVVSFTGSDWCTWAMKFKSDVFDTQEFKDWAAKKVVLLEVDFPRAREQSTQTKEANAGLARKYAVTSYPTVLFLDPSGKVIKSQEGYQAGGASKWIAQADKILAAAPPLKPAGAADAAAEGGGESAPSGDTLAAALKTAADRNLPLLLLVVKSGDDAAAAQADAITSNGDISSMAGSQAVVIRVNTPVGSERGLEEVRIFDKVADKFSIKNRIGFQCLVLDPKAEKLLMKWEEKCDPARVASVLRRAVKTQ